MDRKPKPAETAETKPTEEAETKAAEVAPTKPADEATESEPAPAPEDAPVAVEPVMTRDVLRVASSRSLLPETDFLPGATAPQPGAEAAPVPATETAPVMAEAIAPVVVEEPTASAAPASTEPETIEVWRPAGRSERKPHHARRPRRHDRAAAPQPAADGAAAGEQAVQPAQQATDPKPDQPPRREARDFGDKRGEAHERHDRQRRQEWQKKRDDRNERGDRPRKRDRGAPVDRTERDLYYAKPGSHTRHNKEADPNSPFAKLAALKQQLEDGAKERT
jgi:ATP-dependent RNA helicase SUPV3L1/SUV3